MISQLPSNTQLPSKGSVLGIDVGYSTTRRSNAVCRLDWTLETYSWEIARFAAVEPERSDTLKRLADRPLLAAAFDGPLGPDLREVIAYRAAEQILTRNIGKRIGKPGQSNAPVGRRLSEAANACAKIVKDTGHVASAAHAQQIDETAIVETFPGAALGLMIEEPEKIAVRRGNRSDKFYRYLVREQRLDALAAHVLPHRRRENSFENVRNHDARAALVCALTALGLAAAVHTAVGDNNGWIILPPRALMASWAWGLLAANVADGVGQVADAMVSL